MWRYRWLVALSAFTLAALAYLYAATQPDMWRAEASLVVEDPRALALFEPGSGQRPERYVENQVEIIRSSAVARRAMDLADPEDPAAGIEPRDLLEDTSVRSSTDSDLIIIEYTAADEDVAIAAVNLIGLAYQDLRQEQAVGTFAAALAQLDASIAASEAAVAVLQEEITAVQAAGPQQEALTEEFTSAISTFLTLQERLRTATGEQRSALQQQMADLQQQLEALQLIRQIEAQSPEVDALLAEQFDALDRLSSLTLRRDQMEVDAQLASSGVVLFSPAEEAELAVVAGPIRTTAIGAFLGAVLGAALAYFLALRRRRFEHRAEPEHVLQVPMLAAVPDFGEERIRSLLPVRAAATSSSAEAFRFIATTVEMMLGPDPDRPGPEGDTRGVRSFIVVSGEPGDGKTVVTANAALAVARAGSRVLAIDADFGSQGLTSLLLPMAEPPTGLAEVVDGKLDLARAVEAIWLDEGGRLHLLSRGRRAISASDFFRSDDAATFFRRVRDFYDVILIDSPPLLHVAYASSLLAWADAAVVVVRHGSAVASLEEVRDRIELIGTPVAGYVYNQAPLRRELTGSEASLREGVGVGAGYG